MTNSSITPSAELRTIIDRMTELDRRILDNRDINDNTTDSRDLLCCTINYQNLTIDADDESRDMLNRAPSQLRADFTRMLELIRDHYYLRDDLTAYALSLSLCPLHFHDYAICFDDDDPDCAAIRTIHPSHDT